MGLNLLLAAALAAAPAPATPPDTGTVASADTPILAADPDYLFGHPRGSLALRLGRSFARADSDVFDQTRELFTLDRGDFDAWTFGLDLTTWADDWYDAHLSLTYTRAASRAEYVDWVDQDDRPIEHDMRLSQLMGTMGLKFYPTSRGRAVGQLAWIPRRAVPYLGLSGGLLRYSFEQSGDFVDFDTFAIFEDRLSSGGWTPVGQLMAGLELGITAQAALLLETRFTAAAATPAQNQDFSTFDSIDLMGLQATAGVALRF